jgi:hypothetical protein
MEMEPRCKENELVQEQGLDAEKKPAVSMQRRQFLTYSATAIASFALSQLLLLQPKPAAGYSDGDDSLDEQIIDRRHRINDDYKRIQDYQRSRGAGQNSCCDPSGGGSPAVR